MTASLLALPVHAVLNKLNGLANGLNFFSGVVRDIDVELFFEFHDQFDRIERIGAQIVDERRFRRNLLPIDADSITEAATFTFLLLGKQCFVKSLYRESRREGLPKS
jgi:hypothetical protein